MLLTKSMFWQIKKNSIEDQQTEETRRFVKVLFKSEPKCSNQITANNLKFTIEIGLPTENYHLCKNLNTFSGNKKRYKMV